MVFGDLTIAFDERVLCPRPWTVAQSAWAEELLATAPPGPVLELCAGAGQIGLLGVRRTGRDLVIVDRNRAACRFALANAEAAGMRDRVTVRAADFECALRADERFALILADPPWVRSDRVGRFPDDPTTAIDGGVDGLDVARSCLAVADRHLAREGSMLLQLGDDDQVRAIGEAVARYGRLELGGSRAFAGGTIVRIVETTR